VQVYLTDMEYFQEMNAEYEKWFSHKPARSCIAVKQLPKGVKVGDLQGAIIEILY
jgi:2-iminobutanoate/2-iminopropanoate deaminase